MRRLPFAVALLIAFSPTARDLMAQAPSALPTVPPASGTPYERGCRGDAFEGTLSILDGSMASYPVVTKVPPRTPAAVAGVQVGDTIITQDGVDLLEAKPRPRRFAVGDTIWLGLRRGAPVHLVPLVMGRWINDSAGGARVCRPVDAAASTPVSRS